LLTGGGKVEIRATGYIASSKGSIPTQTIGEEKRLLGLRNAREDRRREWVAGGEKKCRRGIPT